MKYNWLKTLAVLSMTGVLLSACGASAGSEAVSNAADTAASASTVREESPSVEDVEEDIAAESVTAESEEEIIASGSNGDETDTAEVSVPEDGTYTVEFDTDSGMFHINEALEGKGTLTVADGEMTVHISLPSKNIVNLYPGLASEAQEEGAVLLEPTVDEVTYSDGYTEEVYGFDVPVPHLDEEFDLAIIGKKGKWYDHKVSVSNPVLITVD